MDFPKEKECMSATLPLDFDDVKDWTWADYEPHFQRLIEATLSDSIVREWLSNWSRMARLANETFNRLYVATTCDTTDEAAEAAYNRFLEDIYPNLESCEQKLKEKLIASQLEPDSFAIPLRNLRAQVAIFRQENLPLITEQEKLGKAYDKILGAQTVLWDGEEKTLTQLTPLYQDSDRSMRERAYRQAAERQLADREAINEVWLKLLDLRLRLTANAGFRRYTDYMWKSKLRFDYTPQDCADFRQGIEQVVVPAARQRYEKRRQKLGVDSLRPWDLNVDTSGLPALRPFQETRELTGTAQAIFERLDPGLGNFFRTMESEHLLDLENRKGKAPGAYCIDYPVAERPFIFMNAVGLHDDVQTIIHESGHAFHVFECIHLPYYQQVDVPMEFAEVASMAMEFLAGPYLQKNSGGFYGQADAARARIEHLESALMFWPYMAVVDGFQHWAYDNPQAAAKPANCDTAWADLWDRFMQGIDFRGLEDHKRTGWHRKLHIYRYPFYYVEYGLAQLGAVQVWNNARKDPTAAIKAYRKALSLGGTVSLPELFSTAGARFAFDAEILQVCVELIVNTIEALEAELDGIH